MSYTSQIKDQVRIEIGKLLIAHELIKLLPYLDYEKVKAQVNDKWTDFEDVVTARDFWNLVDSLMMGYKLKDLTKDITSLYYTWSLKNEQAISQLKFSTDIDGLQSNTKTVEELKKILDNNPTELLRVTGDMQKEFPEEDVRYLDPIIILADNDNLFVHDGNGRLLKALIENKDFLNVYVGTRINAPKSNQWIPTSYLQRLSDRNCKELLITLLRESDNAISEFKDRVIVNEEFKQEVLSQI